MAHDRPISQLIENTPEERGAAYSELNPNDKAAIVATIKSPADEAAFYSKLSKADRAEVQSFKTLKEFEGNQTRFFNDMASMAALVTPAVAAYLNPIDLALLNEYLKPYLGLSANPFAEKVHENASIPEQIAHMKVQMMSPAFKAASEWMNVAVVNYSSFSAFLSKFNNENLRTTQNEVYNNLGTIMVANAIKPVQHVPRFPMTLDQLKKNTIESLGIKQDAYDQGAAASVAEAYQDRVQRVIEVDAIRAASNELFGTEVIKRLPPSTSQEDIIQSATVTLSTQLSTNILASLDSAKAEGMFSELVREINVEKAGVQKLEVIVAAYLDAYIDGRTKGATGGTVKTPYLEALENILIEDLKLSIDKKTTPEEAILSEFSRVPAIRESMVHHVYDRALVQGIGDNNSAVYVNAVKALVRMGDKAIGDWNKLAEKDYKNIPAFILPLQSVPNLDKANRLGESKITALHSEIMKNPSIRSDVINNNYKTVMAEFIAKGDKSKLKDIQKQFLGDMIASLNHAKNSEEAKKSFIKDYLTIYILERSKGTFGTQKGTLLTYLEKSIIDFNKAAGTPIPEKHAEETLFQMIKPGSPTAKEVTEFIFKKAIDAKNAPGGRETVFVNCLKALVRIGTIKEWEDLCKQHNLPTLSIAAKIDKNNEFKESAIKGFYKSLEKDLLRYSSSEKEPSSPKEVFYSGAAMSSADILSNSSSFFGSKDSSRPSTPKSVSQNANAKEEDVTPQPPTPVSQRKI